MSLLQYACFCGQVNIVNDLISRGVDIEYRDSQLSSFLHHACRSFANTGASIFSTGFIFLIIKNYGVEELLQSLISPYTTAAQVLNQTDSNGNTPLHVLCLNTLKSQSPVKLLLEFGADPNIQVIVTLFDYNNWLYSIW